MISLASFAFDTAASVIPSIYIPLFASSFTFKFCICCCPLLFSLLFSFSFWTFARRSIIFSWYISIQQVLTSTLIFEHLSVVLFVIMLFTFSCSLNMKSSIRGINPWDSAFVSYRASRGPIIVWVFPAPVCP